MLDYIMMFGISAFLLFTLSFRSKYISTGNDSFFDQHNTKAMRGFWCLIVVLVHIPQGYKNPIQDMIGSFAYIGVTFFFMTSAYGLSTSVNKKKDSVRNFWRTRLPKLIIPIIITNVIFALLFSIMFGEKISIDSLLTINKWVRWLIGCYVFFWIGHYFNWKKEIRWLIVCCLVVILSISIYYMRYIGIVQMTTWCTESIGFVWGMMLFVWFEKIKGIFLQKWSLKAIAACLLSLILGVSYLNLKGIIFWGDYILKVALGLAILSFILILNRKIQIGNKISLLLGEVSFEVYLAHGSVLE